MKQKIKNINLPLTICIFSILFMSLHISIGIYNKSKLSSETFRIHIVANSNTVEDQIIKLKIADKIENYINTLLKNSNITKKEIYTSIYNNMDKILSIADNELKINNINYVANAKLGKINYEKKENVYETMDAGSYDSIQILLGKAEGKNYWNLIFPKKDNIKKLEGLENILPGISTIYEDESDIKSTEENSDKTYTFKLLEIIENIF